MVTKCESCLSKAEYCCGIDLQPMLDFCCGCYIKHLKGAHGMTHDEAVEEVKRVDKWRRENPKEH